MTTMGLLETSPVVSQLMPLPVRPSMCTLLGITIERLAYKPLRQAPSLAVLITAIGVSYLLHNGVNAPQAHPDDQVVQKGHRLTSFSSQILFLKNTGNPDRRKIPRRVLNKGRGGPPARRSSWDWQKFCQSQRGGLCKLFRRGLLWPASCGGAAAGYGGVYPPGNYH